MTKVAQIENKGGALAWSPVASHADVIALGAKDSGGVGFDDYGGELELYDLNITCPEGKPTPQLIGSVKTTKRFSSIGWTKGTDAISQHYGMGLLAGGMIDGTVNIWNPAAMIDGRSTDPLVSSMSRHSGGAVSALQFNPHPASANLLATGGSDGEVLITSLDAPDQPNVYLPAPDTPKQGGEITQVAWNTQVAHIVASACGDGSAVVWDLRQKKPWCEIRCEASGIAVSDLAWNPTQGLYIITASADDRNPVMKVWDLRASTTMPLATLAGHTQGILSIDWCPHDDTLLLSCGKDNRTILWDLSSLQPIADVPNDNADDANGGSSMPTMGGLGTSQQKRYDVKWSPLQRGVISTCSFDRKVQAHSVIGLASKAARPPKWLQPASGVSCGFGGTVVSFSSTHKTVKVESVVEEPDLKEASLQFEYATYNNEYTGFCRSMATKAAEFENAQELQVWGYMQVIFEKNAREQLLQYLGFDPVTIAQKANEFGEKKDDIASLSLEETSKSRVPPMSKEAEDTVKQALVVGNFEAAVECCMRSGNLADALLLASCGGADLWAKTQAEYFARETKNRPFLAIVSAVVTGQLERLVADSNPTQWQETLAILSTYGTSEEFPALCLALGDRLEAAGDIPNASLCYMCALDLGHAAKYWRIQLEKANKAKGEIDILALHGFVVKVTVFMQAMDSKTELDPEIAYLFTCYAKALADQGSFQIAAKYCKGTSQEAKELRHRLYYSKDGHACAAVMGSVPEFPFSRKTISAAPARTVQQTPSATNGTSRAHTKTANQNAYAPQQQQPQTSASSSLPSGWMKLSDPTSGREYYYNQTSGETTWDMPRAVKSVTPVAPQQSYQQQSYATETHHQASAMQQPAVQQQEQVQQPATNVNDTSKTPSKMASKYGDGFVTSASHPELAQQYGNHGTSNAYMGTARPGTAAVLKTAKAPVSGNFDSKTLVLQAEYEPIKASMMDLVGKLSALCVTVNDKRQLSEIEKGITVFLKRLSRGDIDSEIASKVGTMISALENRDYVTATGIQTSLVNSDWRDHKDWLKGIKFLIQLASKKL
eukprot:scaffold9789_cov54-Attheya_sp.AAC.12